MRPDDLPDNIKRLNPQIFAEGAVSPRKINVASEDGRGAGKNPSATKPIEIDEKNARLDKMPKLNKTEMRFYRDVLADLESEGVVIVAQPTRFFRLTGGGTYTPDFILIDGGGVTVYEVKMRGAHYHGWEQGIERYKRAAYEFSRPFLRFLMATWDRKKGQWAIEEYEK